MPDNAPLPTVWLLTDDRPGNRTQALGVARALGWPTAEKRLAFNALQSRSTARLGATLDTLQPAWRADVAAPFPDLVIAAGRRAAPVARWIGRESGGACKVVLVGRKTPDAGADLTIRPAYLRQAPSPDLFELVLPLTQVDEDSLAQARERSPDLLEGLTSPRVVFLVGGPTGQHVFSDAFAERMAREVAVAARNAGGGLAILTSRRTPASAVEALRRGALEARLIPWRPDAPENPAPACLARADLAVVTGESESMIAEAVAAGLPVTVYPLEPLPLSAKARIRGAIAAAATGDWPLAPIGRRIMAQGWVTPRRDLSDMHRLLEARRLARRFDGTLNREPPARHDQRADLRARVAALLGRSGAAAA